MQARSYQTECIQALWKYFKDYPEGRPLVSVSTGGGKSYIISLLIESIKKVRPDFKFLIVSHVKEIIEQNAKELHKIIPSEDVGIYSAGLGSKKKRSITFASIQSIYKKVELFSDTGMLIIDEAHMLSPDSNSMYQKLIASLKAFNPKIKILGLTATPMRMDQGSLISEGSVFTDIAYDVSIRSLIQQGYLCPLISKAKESVDLSGVKMSGWDFNSVDLEIAFAKNQQIEKHAKEIIKNGEDRKSWLIFCSGINHAKQVAEKFKEFGIKADYITGEMVAFERDKKIEDFKNGLIQCLCNVNVLTTGFNYPGVDLIGLLRATKSASLYIQMVGRGSRIAPDKKNCLILDYGSNIETHGPVDLIQIKKGKNNKAEVGSFPSKKCPECDAIVPIKLKTCPACEYQFPESSCVLEQKPSDRAVLSQVETFKVKSWRMFLHEKADKPQSIRIEYYTDAGRFCDYLCFNHGGYSSQAARRKWIERGGRSPAPSCTEIAYERQDEIKEADTVSVVKNGKYYEVLKLTFKEKTEENFDKIDGNFINI